MISSMSLPETAARNPDAAHDDWPALWQHMLRVRTTPLHTPEPGEWLVFDGTRGWRVAGPCSAENAARFQTYKPLLDARSARARNMPAATSRPWALAQLGQSLDGCVATASGDSYFVTGPDSLVHLHRLRALCDAVLVGAGTVAADNPLLTTRLVSGPHPVRAVLDPAARLDGRARLLHDAAAQTLWLCDSRHADEARAKLSAWGAERADPGREESQIPDAPERLARRGPHAASGRVVCGTGDTEPNIPPPLLTPGSTAEVLAVDGLLDAANPSGEPDLARAFAALATRDLNVLLIEGGGVTVSRCLAAGLLDRLHLTIAPVIIGAGRRGLQHPSPAHMSDCPRPPARWVAMGEDMLCDLDLRARADTTAASD